MKIKIGDIFKSRISGNFIFKVYKIDGPKLIYCDVFSENMLIGKSFEYETTLLKMQKLSSLEKELT